MAAERLIMREARDVFRLHFERKSSRKIERASGVSRTTIRDYLDRLNKSGLSCDADIAALSDTDLEIRLGFSPHGPVTVRGKSAERVMPDWAEVHRELKSHKSVTLSLLWSEYAGVHGAKAYRYTQYWEYYSRWEKRLSVVMRQTHRAGEKSFVDYCAGIHLVNPETGELIPTELFVGCLGASSYTFAEATLTQKLSDWLGSHARMYEFFDGVSEITVPDNLKSGVSRPCFYEPRLNESYRDLATHYGTAIIPAHVRKPKHKAKVEAAVWLWPQC